VKTAGLLFVIATLAGSNLQAQAAPRVAGTLPGAELSALPALRHEVWVNWFSGDTTALRRVLGPELVAISPGSWQSLSESLAGSSEFKSGGGRLVSVEFEGEQVHRFNDVVVMFSRYRVVTERAGKSSAQVGRATEVFVRAGRRWVHTSWHLDQAP
jgi:hypothetical protein